MQAAVVTGCTGAVGLGLIDALMKNNVKVIAVVRKDSKRSYRIKESHSLKKVECDLSELDKLPKLVQETGVKPDVFYHFGWDGTFGDCRNDMYIQNMEEWKESLIRRFLHFQRMAMEWQSCVLVR